jgi:peptide/nickel transport system permease protein
MSLSILCISIPAFWLALIFILFFSYQLNLFPVAGVTVKGSFLDQAHALVLPVTSLALLFLALVARMTRASMAEVLYSDFIRTVRAKGASERLVVIKHALRNAMLPIITVIGLNTGLLLSGAVLTETVFARPGIGKLLVDSVLCNDYPLVQGIILLIGAIYIVLNLVVDLLYAYLDPRIKYGR